MSRGYRTWTPEPPEPAFGMVMHLGGGPATRLRLGHTELVVDAGRAALFRAQALAIDYADDVPRLVLRIPGSLLGTRLGVMLGRSDVPAPTLDQGIDLTGEPGAGLFRLIRFMLDEIDQDPGLMEAPLVLASWEDLVLTTLLTRLPHSASHLLVTGPEAAPWQVRRAEAWLEAHAADPVTMEELALGVGVPLRTLQHTFRRARGYTPRDFLRRCRLDLAHRRLSEAPPEATVTAIALECGFGHFGDFARDYKRRFGESPSTTLRRR